MTPIADTLRSAALLSLALLAFAAEARAAGAPSVGGDPANGAQQFRQRCSFCHGLSESRFGPRLGDVHGRRAGGVAGFRYSRALGSLTHTWSDATLDAWLQGPRRFAPGVAMVVSVDDPRARADIIAYLRTHPSDR